MSRLTWDDAGEKLYETGVNQAVLYPISAQGTYNTGVAWNGVTAVTENPSGAEATKIYADNIQYLTLYSVEEFGATLEAYTYPDEFAACDGSAPYALGATIGQQTRKVFGLCYKTVLGNDSLGESYGYKLHIIYGCKASPSEKAYQTINDSPEAITFSWEITTVPVNVAGMKPSATVTIDSSKANAAQLAQLEAILYGVDAPNFDQTKTYAVGDYVTKETKVYVCITAITTAGAWDASKWNEITNPGPRLPLPAEILSILGAPQTN